MDIVKFLTLTLVAAFLLFVPKMEAQGIFPPPRPLCASQFTLANYACAMLPFTPNFPPTPPPPAPSPPDDDKGQQQEHHNGHGHGHGHRHGHRHRHEHRAREPSPAEENCCRWLAQIDNSCVCQFLVHLPTFLLRPAHAYTVAVREACRVTYTCGTPIGIKI